MKIIINSKELKNLKKVFEKKEGNLFLSDEAEKYLEKILNLKEQIEEIHEQAREVLKTNAEKMGNFKMIKGESIKVSYRYFGSRYLIDESLIKKIPKDFYKKIIKYNPSTKEIDKFVEDKGTLPLGVKEKERKKTLNFKKI